MYNDDLMKGFWQVVFYSPQNAVPVRGIEKIVIGRPDDPAPLSNFEKLQTGMSVDDTFLLLLSFSNSQAVN